MSAAIVTIAQQKGRAGKSRLAIQLAVAWLIGGRRVAPLDIDPQGGLAAWSALRRRRLGEDNDGSAGNAWPAGASAPHCRA